MRTRQKHCEPEAQAMQGFSKFSKHTRVFFIFFSFFNQTNSKHIYDKDNFTIASIVYTNNK